MLNRADAQARDTTRKHHLEDIEQALYSARARYGTFPPYDQPTWCGILSSPGNEQVTALIEKVLREQNEKYANPDKPFPRDPLAPPRQQVAAKSDNTSPNYFYWKRSPAVFQLYSVLEASPTGERSTAGCRNSPPIPYDYGLTSIWRHGY